MIESCNANLIEFFLERDPQSLDELSLLGVNIFCSPLALESIKRHLFILMNLPAKVHLMFLTKVWTRKLHKDSLRRNRHIKVGRGIKELTHNLEQRANNDRPVWTIMPLLTDASGMLAILEGAGFAVVEGARIYFLHVKTEKMTVEKGVVINTWVEDPKVVFNVGDPTSPFL